MDTRVIGDRACEVGTRESGFRDVELPRRPLPLVAQWIEQIRPKDKMGVRFPPGGMGDGVKFLPRAEALAGKAIQ